MGVAIEKIYKEETIFLKNTQAVDMAARYVKMHNNIAIYL